MTLLAGLGWAALVLLGLIGLALVLPLVVRVTLDTDAAPPATLVVGALGLRSPPIPLGARKTTRDKTRDRAPKARPRRKRRGARWTGDGPALASAALRLLREVIGRIRIRDLALEARLGTGDPAETGSLFGAAMALRPALPRSVTENLAILPDFENRRAEVHGVAEAALRPIALLPPLARFGAAIWKARR